MATLVEWIEGARPRTLPAAFAPVIVGTAAASSAEVAKPGYALLALVVALALQVGVNYANDYSDGVRGTDAERVGPVRLVGQGLASPEMVKFAAYVCFVVAALAGLALVALSEAWVLLLIGAACIAAAWFYTGGSKPYGYRGLGEVMVFIFFGLVATLGTQYTQLDRVTWWGLAGATGVGAIAMAILVANNLRDRAGDADAGKITLAVRLGDRWTRMLWIALVVTSIGCVGAMAPREPFVLVALAGLPLAWQPLRALTSGAQGRELIPVLVGTGRYQLAYAILIAIGVWLGHTFG